MPVLVVGGATPFGHRLIEALLATGGQVRAYLQAPDEELRANGVHVAVGNIDDVERLEAACAQVHTLIHLTGAAAGRRPADEAEALEVTAIAAHAADVVRVVVLTPAETRGRAAREVEVGLRRLDGKDVEVVTVPTEASMEATIEALLTADARR